MKRLLKRIALIVFVGVAVLGGWYGVVAYRYWNNPPQLTRNYSEELNAPVRDVPEAERAWPVYREVMTKLARTSPDASIRVRECGRVPFTVADRVKGPRFLRREAALLERVRAASLLPSLGHILSTEISMEDARLRVRHENEGRRQQREYAGPLPAVWNPPLLSVQLMPVAEMGELIALLQADACMAAREYDADRMVDDLLAIMRIADQFREIPILINDMVSVNYFSDALRTWGYLMDTAGDLFDESKLRRLEAQANSFAGGELRLRLVGERMQFADIVQRCYADDGSGDGYLFLPALGEAIGERQELALTTRLIAPISTIAFFKRSEVILEYDRIMAIAESEVERPLWQCDSWEYHSELEAIRGISGHALFRLAPRGIDRWHHSIELVVQQRDAILTASALLRYRLQHDRWPEDLETLVPERLPELPLDRPTGMPLGYRLLNGRPILYSRGYDGTDDGGLESSSLTEGQPGEKVGSPAHVRTYWILPNKDADAANRDILLWPVISPKELAEGRALVEAESADDGVVPP
jgi:hypothetical protein